jgi:ubiquinone/menaquinone biosynthesis C-methylase UbiE
VDIAENLIIQARARAAAENLPADFRVGDAEQLPFADASFDVVMSMYGAMFAPRPEIVAAELARACRPGGMIAMANWTPDGFVGKSFAVTGRHAPPPVELPKPVLWGTEAAAKERFAAVGCTVQTFRRSLYFKYPFPPARVVEFFREYFGPTQVAYSRLDDAGKAAMTAEMEKLWTEHNEGPVGESHVRALRSSTADPDPPRIFGVRRLYRRVCNGRRVGLYGSLGRASTRLPRPAQIQLTSRHISAIIET